jgi:hypothetical protein
MKRITNQEEQTKRALKDITRRHFLYNLATGIGGIALGSLTGCYSGGNKSPLVSSSDNPLALRSPHFSAQGEECDLPSHGRCTFAVGIV